MVGSRRDISKIDHNIFVNREGPIETIERAVDEIDDKDSKVLVFYGPGGQGKTALCRHVAKHLTAAGKADDHAKVHVLELDVNEQKELDPDLLLVQIRNGFFQAGVKCPTFDRAFEIAWQEYRPNEVFPGLKKSWLAKIWNVIEDLVIGIAAKETPLTKSSIKHIWERIKDHFKWTRSHCERTYLTELYSDGRFKKPHELSDLMPWMLAQDLNDHLSRHSGDRFVLLVDEYERVFGQGETSDPWEENPLDRSMRSIVAETNSLLVVFFSREPLPWEKHPDWQADLVGCQYLLKSLENKDAGQWLEKAGVTDAALRAAMIEGARDGLHDKALAYPLFLELQIEHWEEMTKRSKTPKPEDFKVEDPDFNARCQTILNRLLRGYGKKWEYTLKRLCVADRFDKATFDYVIDTFDTHLAKDEFDRLIGLSFVSKDETGFLTLHRAIRDVLRSSLDTDRHRKTVTKLLEHYELRAMPPSPEQIDEIHRLALFEAVALRQRLGAEDFVGWLARIIEPFKVAAQFRTRELIWRDVLSFLANAQGRYDEAEPLYQKALEIRKRELGEDHPDTATSYNNVAANLNAQGRYDEAEPLYKKALEICEKVLGEDHPSTAASYNNVAYNLDAQGRYGEAEPLFQKALEISKKVLGEDHPDTATSYNNVAANLNAQGRYGEAEPLFRKALEIRKRVLGEDHPDTAMSYSNVASNLNAQGRYEKAEPLYRKAVETMERTLGPQHPNSVTFRRNLEIFLANRQ